MLKKVYANIRMFDMFSVPISLKANSQSSFKSSFAGLISIGLSISFVTVLIVNCLSIFRYENISSSVKQSKIKNENNVSSVLRSFAVSVDDMTNQEFLTMFQGKVVVYEGRVQKQQLSLQPCQIENWPGIDQETFLLYQLDLMLCPQSNTTFELQGTYRSSQSSYVNFILTPCKQGNQNCQPELFKNYINQRSQCCQGINIQFSIFDVQISQNDPNQITEKINFDTNAIVTNKLGQRIFIEFSTFTVKTDYSVLPNEKIQTVSGNYIDQISHQSINYDMNGVGSYLVLVTFTMNQKYSIYTRKVGKLSEALAYTGGLFYLFIPIIGFLILNYNLYNYDLRVAKDIFSQDQQQAKGNTENLLTFFKYTIYKFVFKLFKRRIDWADCKQIDCKKREAGCLMQVSRIFKRIQNLETSLKHSIDKNQAVCLSLTQRPSLKEAKLQRFQTNYYSVVMIDNPGTTIHDIRMRQGQLSCTLQQLASNLLFKIRQSQESKKYNELFNLKQITHNSSASNHTILETNLKLHKDRILQVDTETGKDKLRKVQFKKDKSDLQSLDNFLQCFPELEEVAMKIQLSPIYSKIEQKIAKCFFNMRSQVRVTLQQKIPIIILIRLMSVIHDMRRKRADVVRKGKQKGRSKQTNFMEKENINTPWAQRSPKDFEDVLFGGALTAEGNEAKVLALNINL